MRYIPRYEKCNSKDKEVIDLFQRCVPCAEYWMLSITIQYSKVTLEVPSDDKV